MTHWVPGRRNCVLRVQAGDSGAEVRFRGVPELGDQRMPFQHLLHDASLHALAAAVDQPDLAQSRLVCGVHVFLDDRRNVTRRERVQVEVSLDGDVVSQP